MHCNSVVWHSALALLVLGVGCQRGTSVTADMKVDLTLVPSPPRVGSADVNVKLADRNGAPVNNATVRLEGNMNHAGMKPSFADLREDEPGRYSGRLDFTMGGDWFILVSAKTPEGKMVERKIDVPGVKSQ